MRNVFALCYAGAAFAMCAPSAHAEDPLGFTWQSGMRYWQSTGNTKFAHFSSLDGSLLGPAIWNDVAGSSAETYFRGDNSSGLFVKGNLGGGSLTDGERVDDFSRFGSVPLSSARSGSIDYFSGDIGYSFLDTGSVKVGGFVGYSRWHETMNAFGCEQTSVSSFCRPAILGGNLFDAHEFEWSSWRIGLSGKFDLTPELWIDADAAYLAGTALVGIASYGLSQDGSVENPLNGKGGDGAQFEASLNYRVSDALSLGIGGRYWRQNLMDVVRNRDASGGPPQLTTLESERFGLFAQGTLKLDENLFGGSLKDGGPVASDWSGAYGGIFLGQGTGSGSADFSGDPFTEFLIDTGGFARSVDVNRRGVIAGVEAGYNLIAGEFLLGIEGDAAWTPVAGVGELTRVTFFPFGPPRLVSTTAEQSSTWLATLRARAGFKVTEKLLVYGTGGLAVGDTRLTTNLTIVSGNFGCDPGSCFEAVSEGVRAGFALGAGYEYEIAPGTHWKTDYLYTDLGKRTARIIDPADATLFYEGTAEFQTHSVRTAIVFDF